MGLQVNTQKSATSSIRKESGYVLKKRKLHKWIYRNTLTQPYVATQMGIEPLKFKAMVKDKVPFNKFQLKQLIDLMGAEEAFKVIYFPTMTQRKEVYQKVFGNYKERPK